MDHYLVTGATGFIGQRLVVRLAELGKRITCLSRDDDQAARLFRRLGLEHAVRSAAWGKWDASQHPVPDVVVNLAGSRAVGVRWTKRVKTNIVSSRVESTERLVEQFRRAGSHPKVWLNASAVGYYGPRSADAPLDEAAAPGGDFLATLCVRWERSAATARELGARVCFLRLGIVLGAGGGALTSMLPAFRLGLGGPMGDGQQGVSWIHQDDLVEAALYASEQPEIDGPLNFTAPSPVSNATFARVLGRVLGRPAVVRTPGVALRALLGEGAEPLLTGQYVLPKALQRAGFSFRYTTLEPALEQILT